MDPSIRKVSAEPLARITPLTGRKRRDEPEVPFELDEDEDAPPRKPPSQSKPSTEDKPVASRDEDEAGGSLDVTA